jgi:hypothetical protein
MKLEIPNCPTCGEPASLISEQLRCSALITVDEDGEMTYAGDTELHWDTQEPVKDEGGAAPSAAMTPTHGRRR